MNKKTLLIAFGVLTVAGIGYLIYAKNKKNTNSTNSPGVTEPESPKSNSVWDKISNVAKAAGNFLDDFDEPKENTSEDKTENTTGTKSITINQQQKLIDQLDDKEKKDVIDSIMDRKKNRK